MKKQILILAIFTLALFAGNFKVSAQAPDLGGALTTCITPTPITATCILAEGHLSPQAGLEYIYEVNVPTPAGGTDTYHWMVTTDITFIDELAGATTGLDATADAVDGTYVLAAGGAGGGAYNNPVGGTALLAITWKAFNYDPAAPVFLIVYATDDNGVCTTDNMDVWVIKPMNRFTLDIANIVEAGGTATVGDLSTCVAPVASAIYDVGNEIVNFNYGVNYMFFVVNAANYTTAWQPSFELSGGGLTGTRAITAVDWAYPAEAVSGTWNATTGTSATEFTAAGASVDRVIPAASALSVGAVGECIIVRVTVANMQHETITDSPIILAVDGVMLDPTAGDFSNALLGDIHSVDGPSSECPWIDGFTNDFVTHILTARPDLIEVTPAAPSFEDTNRD